MKRIIIEGNKSLSGRVKIGGAKNSAVALLPAAMLSDEIVKVTNVPNISDKDALINIMELLGANLDIDNSNITVDVRNAAYKEIPYDLAKKLRASYYFMGVLLAKYKKAEVFIPGGCKIGERPIDLHIEGFKALGAKVTQIDEKYIIEADKLVGCPINLKFASVGATLNILFAATKAEGTTTIYNAAKEPEIVNIIDLLNKMGAKISGAGTDTLLIEGVDKLGSAEIAVIPDRIEGGTYVIIGALLGENFEVEGIVEEHLSSLLSKLQDMGINYILENNVIKINKASNLKPINIETLVYPGFPTDLGQPMQILLTQAEGTSFFEETIYENRMGHIKYLNRMGGTITAEKMSAVFKGPMTLTGANITAVDLRGGAALVLAGLIAEGTTIIKDADHILRGYENIINKLSEVGAIIEIDEI